MLEAFGAGLKNSMKSPEEIIMNWKKPENILGDV